MTDYLNQISKVFSLYKVRVLESQARQVLFLFRGWTRQKIAKELNVSKDAIHVSRRNLFKKLGVKSIKKNIDRTISVLKFFLNEKDIMMLLKDNELCHKKIELQEGSDDFVKRLKEQGII